ncbi:MAG: serine--tRNA ligase [Candidatus Wallbacteria bacterium]|nr:serine--tRNA ligase [Candidatus Wallbacteria bacterium]
MLPIKEIRENSARFKLGLIKRGLYDSDTDILEAVANPDSVRVPALDRLTDLDRERRDLLFRVEEVKRLKNEASKDIGRFKKDGKDTSEIISRMQKLGDEGKEKETRLKEVEDELDKLACVLPNIPADDVPVGRDEKSNRVLREHGTKIDFDFQPLSHHELGLALGMMDFERAVKVSGSRFVVLFDDLALLEWALMRLMIDLQMKRGYRLTLPPFLVNSASMFGTGQLPKFEADLFKCRDTDYYLIPTAEVPVTNLHRDEIMTASQLPVKYCSYTPCFRSEAGSYGKDMKGMIRQHQFNKVELVKFTLPEHSDTEHNALINDACAILETLHLPYRITLLSSMDMGFSARKCCDLEVWLPSENCWREISSCSNFGDFQARRANIRFRRDEGAKPEFVHTLNGSGLAIGRTLIAVMETYQQQDGSIKIPEALVPYMGKEKITGVNR